MSFEPDAVRAFEHSGWQRAAEAYGGSFAHATAPFIAPLLDAAGVTAGTHVLDVACGPGYVAATAATRGAVACGLDFSSAMVGVARAMHPAITVTEGDAEALPYPDGSFDAVVSNFGVHHVPRPARALAECHRVLVPGGRMAFTVWAAPTENTAWSLLFAAIDRHGDRAAAKTPPSGGAFNKPVHCLAALETAGFGERSAEIVRAEWHVPNAQALIAAFSVGTVRTAALIAAQGDEKLPAIISDIDHHAARYRRGDRLAIPIAAILAHGRKAA
jgi:ubiquinone/menaquinone biosynthesis C-methylase UbiE